MIIAVNFSNLSNRKQEDWKNQGFNGIGTRDLRDAAIPVRCSTNWAMKPLSESDVIQTESPKSFVVIFEILLIEK